MEEALAAIRRAITDEEAGKATLAPIAQPRTSHDKTDAGLLSREATAAVGSAFNTLDRITRRVISFWAFKMGSA